MSICYQFVCLCLSAWRLVDSCDVSFLSFLLCCVGCVRRGLDAGDQAAAGAQEVRRQAAPGTLLLSTLSVYLSMCICI